MLPYFLPKNVSIVFPVGVQKKVLWVLSFVGMNCACYFYAFVE
jgi:hypothetical protein